MGLFNQGWGIRCDCCDAQVCEDIGGYRKSEIIAIAKSSMIQVLSRYWFCDNEDCFFKWVEGQERSLKRRAIDSYGRSKEPRV